MRMIRFTPRFYVASTLVLLVLAFGFLGPLVIGTDPGAVIGGLYDAPSSKAWLGTDNLGHDVLANLMHGVRSSLVIGLVAGAVANLIGVLIGLIAGYKGGWLEEALMGFTNVVIAIPAIVVLILLSVALNSRGLVTLAVVIGVTSWPWTARAVRAQASSVKTREHLDVARLSGARTVSILTFDILPFLLSYIWMAFVLHVAGAILAEAGLSLLGLGPSDGVSLGTMLHWALASGAVRTGAWWAFIPTTLLLTLLAFALLMLQSSLDEVFNPRLRRGAAQAARPRTAKATAQEESEAMA
jgi:peptide/nickel transport system permease protein